MSQAYDRDPFLTALYIDLRLPAMVLDWLESEEGLPEEADLILHHTLCEHPPRDALLCVALCVDLICEDFPFMAPLQQAARRIIHMHAHAQQSDEDGDIRQVAADLNRFAKSMERAENLWPFALHDPRGVIFSGLTIQAGAQAEIARYVMHEVQRVHAPVPANEELDIPEGYIIAGAPANDNGVWN